MNTSSKVALASASGAVTGYGLATHFLSGGWAILAAFIGAAAGWILFDPIGFVKTLWEVTSTKMSNEWKKTLAQWQKRITDTRAKWHALRHAPWKEILRGARRDIFQIGLIYQTIISLLIYLLIIPINIGYTPLLFGEPKALSILYDIALKAGVIWVGSMCVISLAALHNNYDKVGSPHKHNGGDEMVFSKTTIKVLLLLNFFAIPFLVIFAVAYAIMQILKNLPEIIMFLWAVIAGTCVAAHNNGRLACFVGAGLGTLVGLKVGHPIGALFGGALVGFIAHKVGGLIPAEYLNRLNQRFGITT